MPIKNPHPLYSRWSAMRQRCRNPRCPAYPDYGGRGIGIATEWSDFEVFLRDMGPSFRPGTILDRKDNNGDYSKENCRWVDPTESTRNRRSTVWVSHNGKRLPLVEVANIFGMRIQSAWERVQKFGADTDRWPPRRTYPRRNAMSGQQDYLDNRS